MSERIVIAPKSAEAVIVKRGQTLRVTDIEGQQVADFVCFNETDHAEYFSQGKTRINNWSARIAQGGLLYSNLNNVMFEITTDKVGVHDLLFPPCNRFIYKKIFNDDRTGCLEHLTSALEVHGIGIGEIPDPFNLFMNTSLAEDQALRIHLPVSKADDYTELTARMDCLVAVSSCADDLDDCNGGRCTPIGIEVV
ncbi:MAG: urea carboxylase-associated family protein [Alphaproteobacteria bacterium]